MGDCGIEGLVARLPAAIDNRMVADEWMLLTIEMEATMETYYKPDDLPKFGDIGKDNPNLAQKFFAYYDAVFAEGELTQREKSLIALAVAHAVQCPYCIDAYTRSCLETGSNSAEMIEAVHVATAIRGGASLVHGVQMKNIAEKMSM